MKKIALSILLTFLPVAAQAEGAVWVQATVSGYEVRAIPEHEDCPVVFADGAQIAMNMRADRNADFPRICSTPLPKVLDTLSYAYPSHATPACSMPDGICVEGPRRIPLPVPRANPQRILVLGDTGCRIKGAALQACNDPSRWPFPQLASAAAKLKPDLVIHVGDYLYRESACPPGNQGCAGSPWGDNWITWQADFYEPAAPLLAAAPIVLARGNHEDCNRAGPGWLRLQGPAAFEAGAPCSGHLPLVTVDLGNLRLAVMDDATADDVQLNREESPAYAAELTGMAAIPAPVWFVHHRPIWAAITGPFGIPIGGNLQLIDAVRVASLHGAPPIAPSVELMLSGHIHTFEAINYTRGVPPQIVAGNGGTNLVATPRDLKGAQFQGHSGVTAADGLSVGGFGFLLMSRAPEGWTIDLYDQTAQAKGQCRFTAPQIGARGRLDCPSLKN